MKAAVMGLLQKEYLFSGVGREIQGNADNICHVQLLSADKTQGNAENVCRVQLLSADKIEEKPNMSAKFNIVPADKIDKKQEMSAGFIYCRQTKHRKC